MKKNLYLILGTTAVLATAIAVAACATKKNTAKAAAQPQFRETIAKETIAPDEGQNPVMNFIGNYYGGRACVTVEAKGSDEAEITVVWGDSYNTKAVWTMSGTFNEATTSVFYDNAIKKMITLANGYSYFERFRNRAMYCENYYETYSTEKLPNKVKRVFPKKKTGWE